MRILQATDCVYLELQKHRLKRPSRILACALLGSFTLLSFSEDKVCETLAQAKLDGPVKLITDSVFTARGEFAGRFLEEMYTGRSVDSFSLNGGLLLRHSSYSQYDELTGEYNIAYNGRLIKTQSVRIAFDSSYTVTIYDAKGVPTKTSAYGKDNKVKGTTSIGYTYKADGYELGHYITGSDGKPVLQERYLYNKQGELKESYTPPETGPYHELYRYDNDHNLVEDLYYGPDGKLLYKTSYCYDDKDRESERSETYADTTVKTKTEYRLPDVRGNWQRKVVYRQDGSLEITERKIEYYFPQD